MKYFDKSKITNTESYIVEVYRSAINYTISQINKDLASFGYDAVCFVSGGDAMRRHISSINKSADIDAKLYYKNPKNKRKIKDIVNNHLVQFIIKMTNEVKTRTNITNNKELVFLPQPLRCRNIEFIGKHNKDVLLCSVDFRYLLNYTFNGKTEQIYSTLAILDIAIVNTSFNSENFNMLQNSHFAIASKSFLKKDVENILNSNNRLFSGKRNKNISRLHLLQHNKAPNKTTINTLNSVWNYGALTENEEKTHRLMMSLLKCFLHRKRVKIPFNIFKIKYLLKHCHLIKKEKF